MIGQADAALVIVTVNVVSNIRQKTISVLSAYLSYGRSRICRSGRVLLGLPLINAYILELTLLGSAQGGRLELPASSI